LLPITSKQRPVISAVIPTYNRSALLREALDSVMSQEGQGDLFDLETIVVDDASTDDTPSVVARYPVQYIRHLTNRGLSAARNTGLAASRGQFVAFLDDDDLWLPHRMRVQIPVMESHPDAGVVYRQMILIVDGVEQPVNRSMRPSGDVFKRLLLTGNFVGSVLTILVRRTALDRVGGFFGEGFEDDDMWLRLARYFPFVFVPEPVAVRRVSSKGMLMALRATGKSRALDRTVFNRALALVPNASRKLREVVRDRMELRNLSEFLDVRPLGIVSDADCASQIIAHLSEYPRLARNSQARRAIAWFARTSVLASSSPFDTATTFCDGIRRSRGASFQTRRLLARVWIEVAVGLLIEGHLPLARRAIVRAFTYDPTQVMARLCAACLERVRFLQGRQRNKHRPTLRHGQ
jgi:glycosyltransferase involved in cell wall biosynthesis